MSVPAPVHLSDFELYVMLATDALGDDAYGVTITERISDRIGRDVSVGAVYATLGRLEHKGLIAFSYSDPAPVRGGRARKLVSLTPAGARALRHTAESLSRMLEGTQLRLNWGNRR